MKFSDYELKDFIKDESFHNWVNKTVPDDVAQWSHWLESNPDKYQLATDAADIIRGISFNRQLVSRQKIDAGWERLTSKLVRSASSKTKIIPVKWYKRKEFRQLAAVWVAFLLVSAVGFYFYKKTSTLEYQTGYGETATIVLPDKSTVVLNSNSRLHLNNNWSSLRPREVWLDGEAFFSVVKKAGKGNARFLVHTGSLDVKVLGTKFNVNSRKARTQVVLNSGKVELSTRQRNNTEQTVMQPGELAELSPDKKEFVKKKVNPLLYSSWIHKKLLFNDTSMSEIVKMLEDNYGFQVQLTDPELKSRKLTGEIYVDDIDTLLKALSKSFKLQISQKGNKLLIKGK